MTHLANALSFDNSVTIVSSSWNTDYQFRNGVKKCFFPNPFKRSSFKSVRAVFEIITPVALAIKSLYEIREKYDQTIIYSPSIFWYFFLALGDKKRFGKISLIQRDLFPFWLKEMKLIDENSKAYQFFEYVFQKLLNSVDTIFVQSRADELILLARYNQKNCKIKLLYNWYDLDNQSIPSVARKSEFNILCLGNFGAAQKQEFVAQVFSNLMIQNSEVRCFFMGLKKIDKKFFSKKLEKPTKSGRVVFLNSRTHESAVKFAAKHMMVGLVSLDSRLNPGNIPGKFVAYTAAGIPTIALAPDKFEVSKLIKLEGVGIVISSNDPVKCAASISDSHFNFVKSQSNNCIAIRKMAEKYFSTENAIKVIGE